MAHKELPLLITLSNAYLCAGDENGPHITNNPSCCPCGNPNLASLARILDRPPMLSTLEKLAADYEELMSDSGIRAVMSSS